MALVSLGLGYWYGYGGRAARLAASERVDDRLEAVRLLADKDNGLAVETLGRLAGDPEQRVALAAVRAVGVCRSEPRRRLLGDLYRSGRGKLRAVAAAELGRFERTPPRTLIGILVTDPSPVVRAGAAEGLAHKRDEAALASLADALDDEAPEVRRWAYTALCRTLGMRFGYNPNDPPARRAEGVAFIRSYLARRAAGTLHGAEHDRCTTRSHD